MQVLSIQLRFCRKLTLIAFCLAAPTIKAQSSAVHVEAAPSEQQLRSRLFIYDLHDGSSHLVYSADSIWEARPTGLPTGNISSPTLAGAFTSSPSNRTVQPSRKN
jgi:TolB protein